MPNDNIFSGIPALGDTAGMEQYLNNSALNDMGIANPTTPTALQTNVPQEPVQQQTDPTANAAPAPTTPSTPAVPQYTAEQVAQIVARNQQLEAAMRQPQPQPQQSANSPYTPRQAEIIKQLIDRGVPMERIQQALNGNASQERAQNAVLQRLQNVEAYLQAQEYEAAQNTFISKMTEFGDKFGLSEDDLVTFGNQAMAMGINLTTVNDVEAVFRAVYPEQYAIRSQRIAGSSVSQLYGGSNIPEAPRTATSKLEDAYVDNFLKQAMPNQYSQFPNKR